MTTPEKITLLTIALGVLGALILFGGVSDADIAKCQASTNYSAERCAQEIAR